MAGDNNAMTYADFNKRCPRTATWGNDTWKLAWGRHADAQKYDLNSRDCMQDVYYQSREPAAVADSRDHDEQLPTRAADIEEGEAACERLSYGHVVVLQMAY